MNDTKIEIPIWFWCLTAILLVWSLLSLLNFFFQITLPDEFIQTMEQDQRELYLNYPVWAKFAFGLAVFSGLGGSIALLVKRKVAKTLFIISLLGIIVQTIWNIFIANAIEVNGTMVIVMTALIYSFAFLAIWLAHHSINKNWIK